jgi:MYXO-CTERM domain-containing protein
VHGDVVRDRRPDRGRRAGAFVIAAVASAMGLSAAPTARAWCRLTTDTDSAVGAGACVTSGIPLAWTHRCVSYSLFAGGAEDQSVAELRAPVAASFAAWTQVTCSGAPIEIEATETEELTLCDRPVFNAEGGNANVIAFVSDWTDRDNDPNAFAITSVWHDSRGRIRDADMEVNDAGRTYGVCPEMGACSLADIQNVVTHEAGHFFGLAHSTDEQATMLATAPLGEVVKRSLAADDIAGICDAYPPGALPDSCSFAPEGGYEPTCTDDGGGCACSVPASGGRGTAIDLLLLALGICWLASRRRRR